MVVYQRVSIKNRDVEQFYRWIMERGRSENGDGPRKIAIKWGKWWTGGFRATNFTQKPMWRYQRCWKCHQIWPGCRQKCCQPFSEMSMKDYERDDLNGFLKRLCCNGVVIWGGPNSVWKSRGNSGHLGTVFEPSTDASIDGCLHDFPMPFLAIIHPEPCGIMRDIWSYLNTATPRRNNQKRPVK